jgi:hypothetical protein
MKRLCVLMVVALMAAAALPVFAVDFSWNGELTYGVITDFSQVADAYGNAFIGVTAKADDNNVFHGTLSTAYSGAPITTLTDLTGTTATINAFTLYLSAAYFTSNLGAILGLNGFNLNATYGWADTGATSYSLSGYGYESIMAYDPQGARDNVQLIGGVDVVNLQVSFSPMVSQLVPQTFQPQLLADAYGAVGPVNYSVAYTTNKRTDGMGLVGASVKWGQAFGDFKPAVNAEVNYDISAPATKSLEYGAGVSFAYKTIVTVAAGMNGWTDAGLGKLGINVNVVPITGLGIDLGASMNLATDATTFINGIDGSVWYMLGKSKLRLGYLYTTIAGGSLNAPASLTNGGVYVSWDLTF